MRKQGSLSSLLTLAARLSFSRFLAAAAILHLTFAVALLVAGRYELLPGNLDRNGIGISFAADSKDYLNYCRLLVTELGSGGFSGWLKFELGLHIKLYSLSYAVAAPLFGYTILGAEPLNLIYYLLLLTLVYKLCKELFNHEAGILAAGMTALWPSMLLHTTQLLRDPLFLILFLTIILISASWLTRTYAWWRGLLAGVAGGLASALVWLVRSQMWEVMLCAALIGTVFLIFRQFRERRWLAGNSIGALLLCAFMIGAPAVGKAFNIYSYPGEQGMPTGPAGSNASGSAENSQAGPARPILPPGSPLPARIGFLRHKFLFLYQGAGSNIDTDVEFRSFTDILLYLPRAVMIGLFAPFPDIWFKSGTQVKLAGRLLSGFETFLIYLIEILAALAIWRHRGSLRPWLLLMIILMGAAALGLVVANVAALYRMRFGFWLLLIVLGAEGLRQLMRIDPPGKKSEVNR
ncbi:MAG TPA: glycosyltransferase family 39 protein [Pyrinomonadaceae bacterium]|jgi:hypothetical protein